VEMDYLMVERLSVPDFVRRRWICAVNEQQWPGINFETSIWCVEGVEVAKGSGGGAAQIAIMALRSNLATGPTHRLSAFQTYDR
jgi:hypothetical protein